MLNQQEIEFISKRAKGYEPTIKAFSCMKDGTCSKEHCPAWMDVTWSLTDESTKETVRTPIVGCQFILNPIFTADVISTTYKSIDVSRDTLKRFEKIDEGITKNLNDVIIKIKQGLVAIMNLIGIKDIQRVIEENNQLKKQLEENNIKLIQDKEE